MFKLTNDLPEDTSDRSQVWLPTYIILFPRWVLFICCSTSYTSSCPSVQCPVWRKKNEIRKRFTIYPEFLCWIHWVRRLYYCKFRCICLFRCVVPIRFAATSRKYIKFINHSECKIYSLRTQTHVYMSLKAVWRFGNQIDRRTNELLLQRMCLIYIYYLLTMDNFRKHIVITPDLV